MRKMAELMSDRLKTLLVAFIGGFLPFVKPYILYANLQEQEISKYFFIVAFASILYPVSTLGFSEYSTLLRIKFNKYWSKNKESFLIVEFFSMQLPATIFCAIVNWSVEVDAVTLFCLYVFFVSQSIYLAIIRHNRINNGTSVYRYIAVKSFLEICLIITTTFLGGNIEFINVAAVEIISIILASFLTFSYQRSGVFNNFKFKFKFKFSIKMLNVMSIASVGSLKFNILSTVSLNGDRILLKYMLTPELYLKYLFIAMLKNSLLSFGSIANNYVYSYFIKKIKTNKIKKIQITKYLRLYYAIAICLASIVPIVLGAASHYLPEKFTYLNDCTLVYLILAYAFIYSNQILEWLLLYKKKFNDLINAYLLNISIYIVVMVGCAIISSVNVNIAILSLAIAIAFQQVYIFIKYNSYKFI